MPFDQSEGKWIPWNKGKLVGHKAPLKTQEVWSIRVRLQLADNKRNLALFNLAIDSKLRPADQAGVLAGAGDSKLLSDRGYWRLLGCCRRHAEPNH